MQPARMKLRRVVDQRVARTFSEYYKASNDAVMRGSRPQLPFLAAPAPRQQIRYLTTERKRRWIQQTKEVSRVVVYGMAMSLCGWVIYYALREEGRERDYPTPNEWMFYTRFCLRAAYVERDLPDVIATDHVKIIQILEIVVNRLEDPKKDGAGIIALDDVAAPGGAKDVSMKSEEWRRGYFQALLDLAKSAEHVDGYVTDITRNISFPPEYVHGPSNPRPRPTLPYMHPAPREENCEPAYPHMAPDIMYQKIINTKGFTPRQYMEAHLAYASWLDFKGSAGPAAIMYEDAVQIALGGEPLKTSSTLVQPKTWTLNASTATGSGPQPSANLLKALTAYGEFRARQGDIAAALPIMVSILQARRALPSFDPASSSDNTPKSYASGKKPASERNITERMTDTIFSFVVPFEYPPPPPDGFAPPVRDAHELCEEAALHMFIGEMLYATAADKKKQVEDGLAWTREAVDMAEEQLHRIGKLDSKGRRIIQRKKNSRQAVEDDLAVVVGSPVEARARCRECLASGLGNWASMVARLASEEEAAAKRKNLDQSGGEVSSSSSGSVWSWLWGSGAGAQLEQPGRWAAEEKVVEERRQRAKPLLEDPVVPGVGIMSLFWA